MRQAKPSLAIRPSASRQSHIAGFTLVELLVVIGIIAVLVGVLLPVLGKARESANAIKCMSNLRQFAIADQMYVNQYNWHMPGWWPSATVPQAYNAYKRSWAGFPEFRKALSWPIIPDPAGTKGYTNYVTQKWYCPNAARVGDNFSPNPGPDPDTHEYYFPIHYSYGMNVMGVDNNTEIGSNTDVWDPRATQADPSITPMNRIFHGFKPTQVRRPGEKIFFADAMYFVINTYGVGPNNGVYPGWHGKISNYDLTKESLDADTNGKNTNRTIAWRHRGMANVVFFDGHGEAMAKDRLYNRDSAGNIVRNDRIWSVMQ